MLNVSLFVEDFGHDAFVSAVIQRIADEYHISVRIVHRNVRGGHGRVINELKAYVRDLKRGAQHIPDVLVVAMDANCRGYASCRREVDEALGEFQIWAVYAIPDPHVERWMLVDSAAFHAVFGRGCSAPDHKCDRDRYKELLLNEIRGTGIDPPLGGIEYASDIVAFMDLGRTYQTDASLGRLVDDLHDMFKQWKDVGEHQ